MAGPLSRIIQRQIAFILMIGGLLLIIAGNIINTEILKVKLDHLIAEVGALFLIVGTLHWMFENLLRKEMIKDIATTALSSARIYESGLVDCVLDTKKIADENSWKAAESLIICVHYSPRFVESIHHVLRARCEGNRITKIYVVKPESDAAAYLKSSKSGMADVNAGITRMRHLKDACGKDKDHVQFFWHDRVLRYTFVYTEQHIWIKLFTNSKLRTEVPAIKVETGSSLFHFFENDIMAFIAEAEQWTNE
jgi:hypothetical protein